MKLLTYRKESGFGLGVLVGDHILDLSESLGKKTDMLGLLDMGEKGMSKVFEEVRQVNDKIDSGKTEDLMKLSETHLAAPIPWTRKNIVCLGLNYAEHVKEGGSDRDLPAHPVFFTKPATTINGPFDPVIYNRAVQKLDYEVELAFVIGKKGKYIEKEDVYDHVAGYMVFQDISARTLQRQHMQWYRGKSQDTFAPMGPYLVTPDEVGDPMKLDIWCKVNGETRQRSNTSNLIFDIKTIVSTLSEGITLDIGDVFATGTPSGVGASHPLGLLKIGDVIESYIEKVGTMRNKVAPEE
jgi:2-keto-4-pentenoate hydratase/2-oxohepta-3-ene-1,7-dioic acid hydratase in catechol pathway